MIQLLEKGHCAFSRFFRIKESRDELGLGAIRASFADALFPGTSTIQTRLRYMLFVPWVNNMNDGLSEEMYTSR